LAQIWAIGNLAQKKLRHSGAYWDRALLSQLGGDLVSA